MLHGRVQGVGFRAFVAEAAYRHGADGWVRNRRDGSLEAVFAATPIIVDRLVTACRVGPAGARVDALHQSDADFSRLDERRGGESFSVLPTV
jgi:acylphosphatase